MIEGYIKSYIYHSSSTLSKDLRRFESGSIQDHKDASKHWVKVWGTLSYLLVSLIAGSQDVGPVVESYIGVRSKHFLFPPTTVLKSLVC